jgi:hypothetical protein
MNEKLLREHLGSSLGWGAAHLDWKSALAGIPPKLRGVRPPGAPHSAWELLEHVRIAQSDMVEYSRNPTHVSPDFPSGYWPQNPAPSDAAAWDGSVKAFFRDRSEMEKLITNPKFDLLAPIPADSSHTILREALLVLDHNAYHLGQFVLLRRLLGAWDEK